MKDSKPYTPTSHTSTNSSQEAQRKAGGLRYLKGALGLGGRRGGGLDTRRNTDCRFQLSHKAATERQGQPAKAVRVSHGEEKERTWGRMGDRRRQGQRGTLDEENTGNWTA